MLRRSSLILTVIKKKKKKINHITEHLKKGHGAIGRNVKPISNLYLRH